MSSNNQQPASSTPFSEADVRRAQSPWGHFKNYVEGFVRIHVLLNFFRNFDPVNEAGPFAEWTTADTRRPGERAMREANRFLRRCKMDEAARLAKTENDYQAYGIVAYLLAWDDKGLLDFSYRYPEVGWLALLVRQERRTAVVYKTKTNIPFLRSTFKMLSQHVNHTMERRETREFSRPTFQIGEYVTMEIFNHFHTVYKCLTTDTVTAELIRQIESSMASPFAEVARLYGGEGARLTTTMKYVTGQACCGKTTLLKALSEVGWTVCSRGDLGTFSGKSKSPAAIAGLHAAVDSALRRGDVLGDRGPVDNPLWSAIMHLVDPSVPWTVQDLWAFFQGWINEYVAAYMCGQTVVVFLDPFPELNRQRMLARGSGGDAFRARIRKYPVVQFMAYYMAARLFGWTVRCVPYDGERNFRPERYADLAEELKSIFGVPVPQTPPADAKMPGNERLESDHQYAKDTGIYK